VGNQREIIYLYGLGLHTVQLAACSSEPIITVIIIIIIMETPDKFSARRFVVERRGMSWTFE